MRFDSDPHAVRAAVVSARDALDGQGLRTEVLVQIELALAEALNNVAEHAYEEQTDGEICLILQRRGAHIAAEIVDWGVPLPDGGVPAKEPNPQGTPTADLPEGGFGWYLMRKIARSVRHVREDDQNRLVMEFDV